MNKNDVSDEFLNAFVDKQLAEEEKGQTYLLINQDEDLKRRACELRYLHDLVQLAYAQPPAPALPRHPNRLRRRVGAGLAAAVALALGLALGWLLRIPGAGQAAHPPQALARLGSDPASTLASNNEVRVLFHINSGKASRMREGLDEVEDLLHYYHGTGQRVQVEVLVNGQGINMLRAGASPFPERIRRMQREYRNLTFVACRNTLDRLAQEEHVSARLLPGVVLTDSGVAQIMRREQEGWAYIQV